MKIYRVSSHNSFAEHTGYDYFSSKLAAEREQKKINEENNRDDEVSEYEFPLTKKGVLGLLIEVASHPDNG